MIPEQVWDAADMPERFLFNGHPAGSGMPLVWAHSEYIKLLRSLHEGAIWDLPAQPMERYLHQRHTASFQIWTEQQQRGWLSQGKDLRIDLSVPALVRWTAAAKEQEATTQDRGLGRFTVRIPANHLPSGSEIEVRLKSERD